MKFKTCNKCKQTLDASRFSKKSDTKDGLYSLCKACKAESDKTSRLKSALSVKLTSKFCPRCKKAKGSEEFTRNKCNRDGLQDICKSCRSVDRKNSYKKDRVKILKYNKLWRDSNKDKVFEMSQKYYRVNKSDFIARAATRKSRKIKATPKWLDDKQKEEIKEFYWLAKDLSAVSGEQYHVDHIVPIRGENVCGLHVPWNLQVLPADLNLSKGNKYADNA